MLIILSKVAVGLLMDTFPAIIRGVRTNIGVDLLVDVNLSVFPGVMTAFEFVTSDPLEVLGC